MKSYRIIHKVLFVLALIPTVFSLAPWYLTILLPLALIVPYGVNEWAIVRKERSIANARAPYISNIEHAYRESPGAR